MFFTIKKALKYQAVLYLYMKLPFCKADDSWICLSYIESSIECVFNYLRHKAKNPLALQTDG